MHSGDLAVRAGGVLGALLGSEAQMMRFILEVRTVLCLLIF